MKKEKNWMIWIRPGNNLCMVNEDYYGKGLGIMEAARNLIGCEYIEAVHPRKEFGFLKGTLLLIDEEGKYMDDARHNRIATMCAEIDPMDHIVGGAVLVEEIPEDFDFIKDKDRAEALCGQIMTELLDWDL